MITVKCQECSKEFEAQRTSAKFCSANCRVKFNSRVQTPKEAQQEPETEKTVESTQNQTEGIELHKIAETNTNVEFTYGSGFVSVKGISEELKSDIIKAKTEERSFDQLLKQFNNLIESSPKVSDIKLMLEQIKESAKNSNLTPRQTDAIVDRVNHFLNNNYNQSKHNLKLS